MTKDHNEKPKNVDYFQVPKPLWKRIRKLFGKAGQHRGRGRPRADHRAALNGVWYVLWTGCQWKAVHKDWFGVSSSVLHERFQTWQQNGIFAKIMKLMVKFYGKRRTIKWKGSPLTANRFQHPWAAAKRVKTRPTGAKRVPKCTCWLISAVRRWRFMLRVRMNMTNGRPVS